MKKKSMIQKCFADEELRWQILFIELLILGIIILVIVKK